MFVVPFRNADFKIIYVEEEKRIVYLFLISLNTELTTVFQNLIEYKMKLLQPMNIYIPLIMRCARSCLHAFKRFGHIMFPQKSSVRGLKSRVLNILWVIKLSFHPVPKLRFCESFILIHY